MNEILSRFDSQFVSRISDPGNYIDDASMYRPSQSTGIKYLGLNHPAIHATLFLGRFSGTDSDVVIPWATSLEQYDDSEWLRMTRPTHHTHIKEMEIKAKPLGFKSYDKTTFGYVRPLAVDSFSKFVLNPKIIYPPYDSHEYGLMSDLSYRIPQVTLVIGNLTVKNGEVM